MANYNFRDINTGERFTLDMPMGEREPFLDANPHLVQMPNVINLSYSDPLGGSTIKTDPTFNERLKEISRYAGKDSTVNYK